MYGNASDKTWATLPAAFASKPMCILSFLIDDPSDQSHPRHARSHRTSQRLQTLHAPLASTSAAQCAHPPQRGSFLYHGSNKKQTTDPDDPNRSNRPSYPTQYRAYDPNLSAAKSLPLNLDHRYESRYQLESVPFYLALNPMAHQASHANPFPLNHQWHKQVMETRYQFEDQEL